MILAFFLTCIFLLLKVDNLIQWHWIFVFSPIIISQLLGWTCQIIYFLLTTQTERRLDEIEDILKRRQK